MSRSGSSVRHWLGPSWGNGQRFRACIDPRKQKIRPLKFFVSDVDLGDKSERVIAARFSL